MFEIFKKYVGLNDGVISNSPEEFLSSVEGKTFLNGMYRVFNLSEIEKWCKIVVHTFPAYKGQIKVFAYDWLGRIFAVKKLQGTVLMFEPGTGEDFDIPVTIEDFHNVEIVEYHEDSLASEFFNEWYEKQEHYVLKHNECAGYKVPLFLNGDDVVDNLEISDMEVYWEIMMPLINL